MSAVDVLELNRDFGLNGAVVFSQVDSGLIKANIQTPICTSELFLQGAHLTKWQPAGSDDVLFLSAKSLFQPGKAIRGGIPVIFPWFGARTKNEFSDRTDGPAHGFARTSQWSVVSTALQKENLVIVLKLKPTAISRELGFDQFTVLYEVTLGKELNLSLRVVNNSAKAMQFEEAFHTYLAVADVRDVNLVGLKDVHYFDKTDNLSNKIEIEPLRLSSETDRLYINTASTVTLHEDTAQRQITLSKEDSATTVVWNPWAEASAKMADMEPDGWQRMVCVETANAGVNAIVLGPGQSHTMQATISIDSN
ncbi:MAG: putative glucose-6-phosphate 1-epimerase [Cyanobacteriota bacterium erpe_2018_sw_39hr_WHONDRS-SW48-000098_B_bin.30]|nr:putative glucose-6-phosphate 1-epimerase [Cyanobacteriota bacterium erpe_2018_sw_39hr_WHONDRS-SW48-000098_B_bin.30]